MLAVLLLAASLAPTPPAAAGTTPETAVHATRADYKRWPNALDGYIATPQSVLSKGIAGRAVLLCKISDIGALAGCLIKEETPAGEGFGKAAMKLRSKMKMVPTPKGQERWVLVPFEWSSQGPYLPPACC